MKERVADVCPEFCYLVYLLGMLGGHKTRLMTGEC